MGGILQALASYNPTGFALANQQRQATLGETIARTAQERAATQGTQAQTQATQLANQLTQRKLRDQDALIQSWRDIDPQADPATQEHQILQGIIKNGGSPDALMTTQQHFADVRIKNATATKDEMANRQQQRDEDAGVLSSIINGPEEEKPFQWAKAIPSIQRHLEPGETLPPEYPGDDAAKAGMNHLLYLSAQSKIAKEQAETSKAAAEGAKAKQETDLAAQAAAREQAARAPGATPQVQAAALTAEQRLTLEQKGKELALQTAKLNEELRHNRTNEGLRAVTNAVAQGRLAQEQLVNGIKYGPDNVQYWVKTLTDNPDAIKEVPADIRGTVGKAFNLATGGLPLPVPLEGQLKQNETNAGTALDNISRIRQLVSDPEIQQRLGPILGRLGNVEQRVGAAVGLSSQAEAKAQELRTLMRYFVFQEGKTILGGRLPRQLMQQLESSSASPSMDAPTLAGALNGAEGQANTVRDNAERARFGGKMRPPEMRTRPNQLPQGNGRVIDKATAQQFYQAAGNDPEKGRQLAMANGWKIQ